MDRAPAGPERRTCRAWLLELPEEVLHQILRMVECGYVESGETSEKFLDLMTVCKRFQRAVDAVVTNLSRGIDPKYCRGGQELVVRDVLQHQLSRWSSLRRVELHIHGSNRALSQLVPALGLGCPGLTTLSIVKAELYRRHLKTCLALAHLTSLSALTSLSFTGCRSLLGTLPPLPSLRTLEAHFGSLTCDSPLPALEELVLGDKSGSWNFPPARTSDLQAPRLHTFSPHLRRLSLFCVSMRQLLLPPSLQVLELVNIELTIPLDSSTELPELAELLLVHQGKDHAPPVNPQGLASLLSRGILRRLMLQGLSGACISQFQQLPLHTGLRTLSLHSPDLDAAHVHEAVATLTALRNLDLGQVPGLVTLDISHLQLHFLKLVSISDLASLKGLSLQTQLTSLNFKRLPLLTDLPDFCKFQGLVAPTTATSADVSSSSSAQPHLAPAAFVLNFRTLSSLTKLVLLGLQVHEIDVSLIPFLEELDIRDCRNLSHLSGLHSLPRLHSLKLEGSMPELHSLTVASCPRLTMLSCWLKDCQHLNLEDLPLLADLKYHPPELSTMRVSSCPSLETLRLANRLSPQPGRIRYSWTLESLELSGLSQLDMPCLRLVRIFCLRSVRLVDLANLSGLVLVACPHLESVHVSGCPVTEVRLDGLRGLTAPKLRINDLWLHPPGSPTLPATTSAQPPPYSLLEPEAPATLPLRPASPQTLPELRRLVLEGLPGLLALDQVMLQTGLTSLTLQRLLVSRLPGEWGALSALSHLVLKDLEVACWDPLPSDSFPALRRLTISDGGNLVRWSGPADLGLEASPLPQSWAAAAAFRSITKLDLSESNVASVDVSELASIQELVVHDCASLTCLAGINNLLELTSLHLSSLPKLQGVAIISCPKFESLSCSSISPRHFHMEDLPSLVMKNFSCDRNGWLGFSGGMNPGNPLASLRSLKLRRLPTVSTLRLEGLDSLESVEVVACSSLHEVSLEELASLTSLRFQEPIAGSSSEAGSLMTRPTDCSGCIQELSITNMAKLQAFQCPPTLRSLSICSCWALTSLPLDNVPHLGSLKLSNVAEEVFPPWFRLFQGLWHVQFDRPTGNLEG